MGLGVGAGTGALGLAHAATIVASRRHAGHELAPRLVSVAFTSNSHLSARSHDVESL
jgi:hypothetical protein